jgi:CheY-like chemotaxis protein
VAQRKTPLLLRSHSKTTVLADATGSREEIVACRRTTTQPCATGPGENGIPRRTGNQYLRQMAVRRHILVADDNAAIRKTLCDLFADHATLEICDEAVDGQQAVAKAIKHRPDLIILDFSMPMMNGLQAAQAIRRVLPNVPIVVFTLYAEAMSGSRVSVLGMTRVVSKSEITSSIF